MNMMSTNKDILNKALTSHLCIISVMGAHAGEDSDTIFKRKIRDIKKAGKTFWLIRSSQAKPFGIQEICNSGCVYTIFVEPSSTGSARPTKTEEVGKELKERVDQ